MTTRTRKLRFPIHLLLAASLLALGWFQLHHKLTAHLHDDGAACEICVFAGQLGDGVIASPVVPVTTDLPIRFSVANHYATPFLEPLFRSSLSQRGPPIHSPA
ncbi:MAG: hypothetical protein P8103_07220 [Candidatus Thiodiazotropha sp.]